MFIHIRAQKMREERKRQKDHIKKEEEKQKELERRQLGKEMTKFKGMTKRFKIDYKQIND